VVKNGIIFGRESGVTETGIVGVGSGDVLSGVQDTIRVSIRTNKVALLFFKYGKEYCMF
jgi:hypothetical protein